MMTTATSRYLPIIEHPAVNPDTLVDYAVYLYWDDEPTGCYFLVPIHEGAIDGAEDGIYNFYDMGLAIHEGVIPETVGGQKVDGVETWTQWTALSPHDPIHAHIACEVFDFARP